MQVRVWIFDVAPGSKNCLDTHGSFPVLTQWGISFCCNPTLISAKMVPLQEQRFLCSSGFIPWYRLDFVRLLLVWFWRIQGRYQVGYPGDGFSSCYEDKTNAWSQWRKLPSKKTEDSLSCHIMTLWWEKLWTNQGTLGCVRITWLLWPCATWTGRDIAMEQPVETLTSCSLT